MATPAAQIFRTTVAWRTAYPGALAGVLVMEGVTNPTHHPALEAHKTELEHRLRERYRGYNRSRLRALPVMQAYAAYYRRFKKTYHVLLQLASLVLKGKPLPRVMALVEVMFMTEMETLLLTAGHDLDQVQPPVTLNVAGGGETYTRLNGSQARLKPGDMYMADQAGVLSSILYGPDFRTRLTAETRRALFTVYAPAGIGRAALEDHLTALETRVRVVAPGSETKLRQVFAAGQSGEEASA